MSLLKMLDSKDISLLIMILVAIFIYFKKDIEISILKESLTILQDDLITEQRKSTYCNNKLDEQNKEIEKIKIDSIHEEPKIIERIKKIEVKDKSCQSTLKAYKELFNE